MTFVHIHKCKEYNVGLISKLISEILIPYEDTIKKSKKILIKPNQLMAKKPDEQVCTHPEFIEGVIIALKKYKKPIAVGDCPGFNTMEKVGKITGLVQVCKRQKVPLLSLEKPKAFPRKENKLIKKFVLAKSLSDYDLIVNLPKLKTHTLTVLTGAVKNLFGLIPGMRKARFHLKLQTPELFSKMLLDLYETINPQINIMDGIIGMEGQGPNAGIPRKANVIISSDNALAMDDVAAKIMGLNVPMLNIAAKRGQIPKYKLQGEIKNLKFKLPVSKIEGLPPFLKGFAKSIGTRKPVINHDICVDCKRCVHVCPTKAIDKNLNFDYEKCIRCYCCQELCPEKAITLKLSWLLKLFSR